jgi:hypothetical protein
MHRRRDRRDRRARGGARVGPRPRSTGTVRRCAINAAHGGLLTSPGTQPTISAAESVFAAPDRSSTCDTSSIRALAQESAGALTGFLRIADRSVEWSIDPR